MFSKRFGGLPTLININYRAVTILERPAAENHTKQLSLPGRLLEVLAELRLMALHHTLPNGNN